MEDGNKVQGEGSTTTPRTWYLWFSWPPSSPDLNPIEKVWQWMKEELKKLPYVAKSKEGLKEEIMKLWDQVDPHDQWHYIEQLTCKLEDVIEVQGLATIN